MSGEGPDAEDEVTRTEESVHSGARGCVSEDPMPAGIEAGVPEGFRLVTHHAAYGRHNGPFYQRGEGAEFVRAFRVLDRHLNRAGIIHGGMIATFADMILGQTVHGSANGPAFTVRLVTDYLGPARAGDWLEGRGRLLRRTRILAFAEADLSVGGRRIAKASGVFRIDSRPARSPSGA